MIENIIRVNREEFDRLSLLTEKEGYIAQTFNIATQDLFPLHKIHYVFDNINPGEIYEVDLTISAEFSHHIHKMVVFHRGKCIGLVSVTMRDFDPARVDWDSQFKVKAIVKGKENWLKEIGLMTTTFNMIVAYSMLNSEKVFVESFGKHRLKGESNSDSDELLYHKLKAFVSTQQKNPTKSTGKGHSPKHEFDVRGHERHLKSGKIVHVKGYTKCKGRGTKIIHEYVTGGETNG